MVERKQRNIVGLVILTFAILLAAGIILAAIKQKELQRTPATLLSQPAKDSNHPAKDPNKPAGPSAKNKSSTPKTAKTTEPKIQLKDIIRKRRSWNPVFKAWYGIEAPAFALTDINGKVHKLSDYRGKDVLLIFWATWCGPCVTEIPHLITLRNTISEDKLAILAISNEPAAKVKKFVADRKINYTIFSYNTLALPAPYSLVDGIPTTFFIDPKGKIKLAAVGTISSGEIRAILQAE